MDHHGICRLTVTDIEKYFLVTLIQVESTDSDSIMDSSTGDLVSDSRCLDDDISVETATQENFSKLSTV